MNIGCISDLHGNWNILENQVYEEVETLIIAGDLCNSETVYEQEIELKNNWNKLVNNSIFPNLFNIIIVPGNHDYWIEKNYKDYFKIRHIISSNITILVDEMKEIEGIKFYGNPRSNLYTFAFPRLYGNEDINKIPENIDILITHEAPRIHELDCIKYSKSWYNNESPGNKELAEKVLKIKPKYHIFGHIHYPCQTTINNTVFMNVSQLKRNIINPKLYIINYDELY